MGPRKYICASRRKSSVQRSLCYHPKIAKETGQEVIALASGFSDQGPDLGSNKMQFISNRNVGILKSDRATPAAYGEVWHFFEQQLHPLSNYQAERLSERFLNDLDVLIIPSGYYRNLLDKEGNNALMQWMSKGGRVVAIGNAVGAFANHDGFSLTRKSQKKRTRKPLMEKKNVSKYGLPFMAVFTRPKSITRIHWLQDILNYFSLKTNARAYALLEDYGTVAYLPKIQNPSQGSAGTKPLSFKANLCS